MRDETEIFSSLVRSDPVLSQFIWQCKNTDYSFSAIASLHQDKILDRSWIACVCQVHMLFGSPNRAVSINFTIIPASERVEDNFNKTVTDKLRPESLKGWKNAQTDSSTYRLDAAELDIIDAVSSLRAIIEESPFARLRQSADG